MVWLEFVEKFNGECYIPERYWITNEALELITDSTGNNALLGCGAYFSGHWVQYRWPSSWENTEMLRDITFLELVPIVLSLIIWSPEFKDKKILLYIDNQAFVSIINKRTSKSKRIMKLIRRLVLFTMCNNILFKAVHLDGVHNKIADALTRFQYDRFMFLAPQADQAPTEIPSECLRIISELK